MRIPFQVKISFPQLSGQSKLVFMVHVFSLKIVRATSIGVHVRARKFFRNKKLSLISSKHCDFLYSLLTLHFIDYDYTSVLVLVFIKHIFLLFQDD